MKRKIAITGLVLLMAAILVCGGAYVYSLLLLGVRVPGSQFLFPPPQNTTEALALLTPEKHVSNPYLYLQSNPQKIPGYSQQVRALQYIRDHRVTAAIPNLIQYLDYGISVSDMLFSQMNPGPDRDGMLKIYPALAALIEMPESKEILEKYALNQKNPVAYRVASMEVLRDIDVNESDKIYLILKDQIKDPKVQAYLESYRAGAVWLAGVPEF